MFLSIIVPVYNVATYVRQCLDSIAALEGNDIEVILIDDGSTDGSGRICDEYAAVDGRMHVVHKENGGVAAARNSGLDMARGRWLWFVDSDDWLDTVEAEHLISTMRAADDDVDFVQFGHRRVTEAGEPAGEARLKAVTGMPRERFLATCPQYLHWCTWYRRDILEHNSLRMSPGLRIGEDMELLYSYEMYVSRPIQTADMPYVYRQRKQSALHNEQAKQHAVSDGLIIMTHWAERIGRENIAAEAWIDRKLLRFAIGIMHSARFIPRSQVPAVRRKLAALMKEYRALGFRWPGNMRMRLAAFSPRTYFILNNLYLRLRGLE